MNAQARLIGGIALAGWLVAGAALAAPPGFRVGDVVSDVPAVDQTGNAVSVHDYSGKVLVLHFCALFCAPCRSYATGIPAAISALDATLGAENYQILEMLLSGHSAAPSTLSDAQSWAGLTGPRPVIMHTNGVGGSDMAIAYTNFDLTVIPSFVVVDPSLRVVEVDNSSGVTFDMVETAQGVYDTYTTPAGPTVKEDFYVALPDELLVVSTAEGVLANDFDPNGDAMTAALVMDAAHGTLNLNADGSFTYDSPPGLIPDSFTYRATAGGDMSVEVLVTLDPGFDYAVAEDDFYDNVAAEATWSPPTRPSGTRRLITDNDSASPEPMEGSPRGPTSDVEVLECAGADEVFLPLGNPVTTSHGTVQCNYDGGFFYTADPGYRGPDSFQYKIRASWGGKDTDTATVHLQVVERPVLQPGANWTVWPDITNLVFDEFLLQAFGGLVAFPDVYVQLNPSGNPLTLFVVSPPSAGDLDFYPDGQFAYTPDETFEFFDIFWVQATDGVGLSDPMPVSLHFLGTTLSRNDVYATGAAETLIVPAGTGVLVNDEEPDKLPFELVYYGFGNDAALPGDPLALPSGGMVTMQTDGSFTYEPPGARGGGPFTEVFHYATDSIPPDDSAEVGGAAVIINVDGVPNLPPTADAGGPYSVHKGYPIMLDGTGSTDPDMDGLSYSWSAAAGSFTDASLAMPTFTAPLNLGPVEVTLTVDDGNGGVDMHTVEVFVVNKLLSDTFYSRGFE